MVNQKLHILLAVLLLASTAPSQEWAPPLVDDLISPPALQVQLPDLRERVHALAVLEVVVPLDQLFPGFVDLLVADGVVPRPPVG